MSAYDLVAARQAAGQAYIAAAQAYVDAWVTLQALDQAWASTTGYSGGFGAQPVVCGHAQFLKEPSATTADPVGRASALNAWVMRQIQLST